VHNDVPAYALGGSKKGQILVKPQVKHPAAPPVGQHVHHHVHCNGVLQEEGRMAHILSVPRQSTLADNREHVIGDAVNDLWVWDGMERGCTGGGMLVQGSTHTSNVKGAVCRAKDVRIEEEGRS
jgi:hypothetical protein